MQSEGDTHFSGFPIFPDISYPRIYSMSSLHQTMKKSLFSPQRRMVGCRAFARGLLYLCCPAFWSKSSQSGFLVKKQTERLFGQKAARAAFWSTDRETDRRSGWVTKRLHKVNFQRKDQGKEAKLDQVVLDRCFCRKESSVLWCAQQLIWL